MSLSKQELRQIYLLMLQIRIVDEKIAYLMRNNLMRGFSHQYIGQEAVAVGVCKALRDDDYIASTHRGHGHCLAKSEDIKGIVAELLGKKTGFCKGKGGSMHIADVSSGNLGANGIVAGGIPIAVGAAFSAKYRGTDQVVVSFFGDGATNQGSFHESVNFAAVYNLPVVFVCENNLYGFSTSQAKSMKVKNIVERAPAYGIKGLMGDGNDVLQVYDIAKREIEHVRSGKGPVILEYKTYRWTGHSVNDPGEYKPEEEQEWWKEKCPIKRFRKVLAETFTEQEIQDIEREAAQSFDDALKYAMESPYPEKYEALEDIYA